MTTETTLKAFLDARRTTDSDSNITGMAKGIDLGKYVISDQEYDTFLELVHHHIFVKTPKTPSSLLEKHRSVGPILIDLDFRHEADQPLVRRYTDEHIRKFVAESVAAMAYFFYVIRN